MCPKQKEKCRENQAQAMLERILASIFDQIYTKTTEEAPYGVVFLDEVDKLAKDSLNGSFGDLLQDELIGWLEDAVIQPTTEKKGGVEFIRTRNLLFVCAGAFQDPSESLTDLIKKKKRTEINNRILCKRKQKKNKKN